jgi:GNAT superfamily N-acetyltransferase
MSSPAISIPLRIRPATANDAEACGKICYEAFATINRTHGFDPEIPSPDVAIGFFGMMISHPGFYCIVAESDGRVIGSNCLDERGAVAGVGPITVEPSAQNRSVGRALMQAILERARERNSSGVRLLQAAFHGRSLSLYTKLGFDAREPISVMQGPSMSKSIEGCTVRAAELTDLDTCDRLCESVHGHNRSGELLDGIRQSSALVAERDDRVTGYASAFGYFGHVVGETNLDVQALIAAAPSFGGPGILVPTRNAELFRWCLHNGLRVTLPMTLMTMGVYNEPSGAYLPSILY